MARQFLKELADGVLALEPLLDRLELVESQTAALERTVADQAALITALNGRAAESDRNLQSLISAVERLCSTVCDTTGPKVELPFEAELNEAVKRNA